jgi:hypothetical protein
LSPGPAIASSFKINTCRIFKRQGKCDVGKHWGGQKKRTTEQKIEVRKGQVTEKMLRDARQRFMARFYDPAFRAEDASLARVEDIRTAAKASP